MNETDQASQMENTPIGRGPVGSKGHRIREGECIESIAFENGLFWETIWDDQANAELKRIRKNPNALLPGDKVVIPEKRNKEVSIETENTHRFKRLGVPSRLYFIVEGEDGPCAEEPYVLDIDGQLINGTTNSEGEIRESIAPDAKTCLITVGKEPDAIRFEVKLGHIDPIDEVSGVKARLNNLGYDCGEENDKMNEETIEAIKAFQENAGLPVTGQIDQATLGEIESVHGS